MGKLVDLTLSDEQKDIKDQTIPIFDLIDRRGWDWVCNYRQLPESFIEEWMANFDVRVLLENQIISESLSKKFRSFLHYKLKSRSLDHIYSNTSYADLRDMIKNIVKSKRENDWGDGNVSYDVVFSGAIGKKMYNDLLLNKKIRVRTKFHNKKATINCLFDSKNVSNKIVFNDSIVYNYINNNRIFII